MHSPEISRAFCHQAMLAFFHLDLESILNRETDEHIHSKHLSAIYVINPMTL